MSAVLKQRLEKVGFDQKSPFNEIIVSRENYTFDPNNDTWKLSKEYPVNFKTLSKTVERKTLNCIKAVLINYAKEYSVYYCQSIIVRLNYFYKNTNADEISHVSLMNYRSTLDEHTECRLGCVVAFIKYWHRSGLPGVTDDAIEYLNNQTLKGNQKGVAVQLLDPIKGPLSDNERQALIDGAHNAYHNGDITTEQYCKLSLFIATGSRPIQISALKVKDIFNASNESVESYFVNMPMAKDRRPFRTNSNPKPLNKANWYLSNLHAQDVIESVRRGHPNLHDSVLQELPLFPNWSYLDSLKSSGDVKDSLSEGMDIAHISSNNLRKSVETVAKKINAISERTGSPLKVNVQRLRYSIGTNLARDGVSLYGIAEALDQSDTQNAGVYTKNNPEFIERITEATNFALIPLAQAFTGMLVDHESDATNGENKNKRIRFLEDDNNVNLATCGEQGFCSDYAPIACYTCGLFQPWLDAPHEIVLNYLFKERDRLEKITERSRVSDTHNRTILAVIDVIKKCKEREKKLSGKTSNIEVIS